VAAVIPRVPTSLAGIVVIKTHINEVITSFIMQRAFHRFGRANFPDVSSVFGSSQFTLLPLLPLKMMLENNNLTSFILIRDTLYINKVKTAFIIDLSP